MVKMDPARTLRLVTEALGTGAIPSDLSAIPASHFREVRKGGMALPPDKRSGRGIHSFLAQLESGVNQIHGLEWVSLIGVNQGGTVNPLQSLFSAPVHLYSTS